MLKRLPRAFAILGLATAIAPTGVSAKAPDKDASLRAPTLTDIVETRSIDGLTLSPDGRRVAFRVLSPSVERNETVARWFVADLRSGKVQQVGTASQPVRVPIYDFADEGKAQWSPDGRALFVLSQVGSQVQVHRVGPGSVDRTVTHDDADVVSFVVAPDGRSIRYKTGASRVRIADAQADDERLGIHFDRTVATEGLRLTRNFLIGNREVTIRRNASTGVTIQGLRPLLDKTVRLSKASDFPPVPERWRPPTVLRSAASGANRASITGDGTTIGLSPSGPLDPIMQIGRDQLTARHADGHISMCDAPFCNDFASAIRLVTTFDATHEVIVAHEAEFSGRTRIYGWRPGDGHVRLILDPGGALDGGSEYTGSPCVPAPGALLCVFAASTSPPELVRVDLLSGRMASLFDPNLSLRRKHFPSTTFLTWRDDSGRSANGILVLPQTKPQEKLPLVITTYHCRGFLEGGTGRLAPEVPLAEHGFAVLCVNNNTANVLARDADGTIPPLGMHKAALDSYRAAIDLLARRGTIDRSRVGIAGHSFSSNVIAYGISHTSMFAAAVIGTGVTIDPASYPLTAPTADSSRKEIFMLMGLPAPDRDPAGLWRQISPALNADKVTAPLLIQPPESEYLLALPLYTYLQDQGRVVDMYVYPREGHAVERWPVHQLLRAQRSIDWFTRWLTPTATSQINPPYPPALASPAHPNKRGHTEETSSQERIHASTSTSASSLR